MNFFKKIFPDPLLFYLLIALILAYILPEISLIKWGSVDLDLIIDIGVLSVFFFYGLKLNWKEVFNDIKNWKFHIKVQLITFLLFPLLGILFYPFAFFSPEYYTLFLSIFYLCSLPSTVSSSVVMVSLAKGNVTKAIFNASVSGLIGIILTPLWMSLFLKNTNDIESTSVFLDLSIKVLLPVFIGAILQPYLGKFYSKYKNTFSNIDKLTIVLIVFNSFSHNFLNNYFKDISYYYLIICLISVVILFLFVFYFLEFLNNKLWKYSKPDFITLQFCGTKKSLVHGSVIGSILFGNEIGIYLLPIMLYHTFQLVFISYKSTIYAKED